MEFSPTWISFAETASYLGCRGEIPASLRAQIAAGIEQAAALTHPRVVWRELEKEALPLPGKDIAAHLAESRRVLLFAATVGAEADRALRRAQLTGMADAFILDACLSAAAEAVCERFCQERAKEYAAEGLFLTERFSPGYGDLPLSVQGKLLELLNASRRIGLTVTPGGLMVPCKSVTAVLGIAGSPQPHRITGCRDCPRYENCHIRKEGSFCGK